MQAEPQRTERPAAGSALALAIAAAVLLYVAGYALARATHGIVHARWGALGRGGCSRFEPATGAMATAFAPLTSTERFLRRSFDASWGRCPTVTE